MWLQLTTALGADFLNDLLLKNEILEDSAPETVFHSLQASAPLVVPVEGLNTKLKTDHHYIKHAPVLISNEIDIPSKNTELLYRNTLPTSQQRVLDFEQYTATTSIFRNVAIFCLFDVLFLLRVASTSLSFKF